MLCSRIVGIVASCLSFILLLTGLLTDYWLVNFGVGLFHEGLWQRCTKNVCEKLPKDEGFIDATRGLLIVSAASLVLGTVASCVSFTNLYVGKVSAALIASVMEFIAAIFLVIGMSVYTGETSSLVTSSSYNYQWSFFLCWSAVLSLFIAAISHILAHKASPAPGYDAV
ncbi:lens fiber membrane intrinsic protein-like [Discoglossus pictus]